MSLLQIKNELEIDLAEKEASVIRCAEAAHNLAVVLRNENDRFWSIPTDRLLALMNHDVESTNAIFSVNSSTAYFINDILDQINLSQFTTRAPNTTGRDDIIFDGDKFIQTQTNNTEQP